MSNPITDHPCQYPVELIERLVLCLTNQDDWVFDLFLGTGTTVIAAIRHERRGMGAETVAKYVSLAHRRIQEEIDGTLRTRPMTRPVYDPVSAGNSLAVAPWTKKKNDAQLVLLEKPTKGRQYTVR